MALQQQTNEKRIETDTQIIRHRKKRDNENQLKYVLKETANECHKSIHVNSNEFR